MANLLFKQGLYSSEMFGDGKLAGAGIKNFSEGTIYVVTDQKAIYLDTYQNKEATTENRKRIRIQGLVQYYESLTEWSQSVKPPYSTDVIYFIAKENAFMRYDDSQPEGSKWVQLNTTAKTANDLLTLIQTNKTSIDNLDDRLEVVENAIGSGSASGSILDRLSQAERDIDAVEGVNTTQDNRIKALEDEMGNTVTTPGSTTVLGRLATAESNITSVTNRVDGHDDDLEALDERVDTIESDLNTASTGLKARMTSVENRATSLETRATNLETSLNNTTNGVLKRLDDIEAKNNTQDTTLNNHSDSLEMLIGADGQGGKIKEITTNISGLDTRMTNAENAIGSDDKANTVKGRIKALETAKSQHDETLENHASLLNGLRTDVNNNSDSITSLGNTKVDKSVYNEKMSALDKKDEDLTGKLTTLTSDFTTTKEDHTTKISGLTERMTDAEALISTIGGTNGTGGEVGKLISRVGTLENDLNAANTGLKAEMTSVKGRVKTLEDTLGKSTDASNTKTAFQRIEAAEAKNNEQDGRLSDAEALLSTIGGTDGKGGEIKTLTDGVKAINDKIGTESTSGTMLYRIKQNENNISSINTKIGSESTSGTILYRIKQNESSINTLSDNLNDFQENVEATYATKTELGNTKTELQTNIDNHIKAANAMVYKEGVESWSDLQTKATANTELSIGHTYIATKNFNDTKTGYEKVYAGDILIATGTEVDGKLTFANTTWVHVSSGYVLEHMPELAVVDNKITLTSLNGQGQQGDLGEFEIISGSNNVSITLNEAAGTKLGNVTVGLVWDTF